MVDQPSNREGTAHAEIKPGIELIINDQFDLVGGIRSNFQALNVIENINKLSRVLVMLTLPIGTFSMLL